MINKSTKLLFLALFLCVLAKAQKVDVIPHPNKIEIFDRVFNLSTSTPIYYDKECKNEAIALQQLLADEHQLKLPVSERTAHFTNDKIYPHVSPALLDEVMEMFPSKIIHIGGDEGITILPEQPDTRAK
jgi:hypothetical protein